MKKVMLALAAGVVLFASCKKDYVCTCTIDDVTTTTDYEGLSKAEATTAETACKLSTYCTWSAK
jgi:hypothetical protein